MNQLRSPADANSVYIAAGLFTPFDRERNSRLGAALQAAGLTVFLPQSVDAPRASDGSLDLKPVYEECRRRIREAAVVLALVDGAEVDTGVAWELGYAAALNVPSLCVRTDFRRSEHQGVNIMVEYGCTQMLYLTGYRRTVDEATSLIVEAACELISHAREQP